MNAIEFVKKFGWDFARDTLNVCSSVNIHINDDGDEYFFDRSDLKRLVESWELVESLGGMMESKQQVKLLNQSGIMPMGLIRAIADVENCK